MSMENESRQTREASEWLQDHGVAPYTEEECADIFPAIVEQVRTKVMFPSLLEPRSYSDRLIPSTNALIIETGGSKNRASAVSAEEFLFPESISNQSRATHIEMPFPRTIFRDADDFFDTILDLTRPAIEAITAQMPIHALAIVYSFPGPSVKTSHGVDIMPTTMTKKFVVPNIERYPVGETMLRKLQKRGFTIAPDAAVIVTNDVVGGMLYHTRAHFSLIDGTGFNIGIAKPDSTGRYHAWNTESGNTAVPLSKAEQEVNRLSENPGMYLAETIAGGTYIASQLNYILSHMHREGIILHPHEPVTSVHLTEILTGNRAAFSQILPGFTPNDEITWNILEQIAKPIRDRAVQTMGMVLAAQMLVYHPSTNDTVLCTTEGSTLHHVPGLLSGIQTIAEELTRRHIEFLPTSGARGAGFATLREYAQMHG